MYAIEYTILGTSILLVNFETEREQRAYDQAVREAYEAIKSKKYLSPEEQDKLEQAVVDATRKFVRLRRVLDSKHS